MPDPGTMCLCCHAGLGRLQIPPAISSPPDLLLHYHFSIEHTIDVYRVDDEFGYQSSERRAAEYGEGT